MFSLLFYSHRSRVKADKYAITVIWLQNANVVSYLKKKWMADIEKNCFLISQQQLVLVHTDMNVRPGGAARVLPWIKKCSRTNYMKPNHVKQVMDDHIERVHGKGWCDSSSWS